MHFNTSETYADRSLEAPHGGVSPLRKRQLHYSGDGAKYGELEVRGVFDAIGYTPNATFLRGSSRLRFDAGG